MRPGARAATALAGLVLVIGGAFAVFLALSGSGRTLTGGATTVPVHGADDAAPGGG